MEIAYDNRSFYNVRLVPALKAAQMLKYVRYENGKDPAWDEILVKVLRDGQAFTKGWLGLAPDAVRAGDADNPAAICTTLRLIHKGRLPTAAFQYMLSVPHQYRIRWGVSAPVRRITEREEFKSDKAPGTSAIMNREFDKNVAIEQDVRKRRKTEDTDAEVQAEVDAQLDKALDPAYKTPLGLTDQFGNPVSSED